MNLCFTLLVALAATTYTYAGLECPRLGYPFVYEIDPSWIECEDDGDCKAGEKCCYRGSPDKLCVKGIDTTPKSGSCPTFSLSDKLFNPSSCRIDYMGCRYDSQCAGNQICCKSLCGYRECTNPAVSKLSPDAGVFAKDLACPSYPFGFDVKLIEPICSSDEDCEIGERCCFWGRGRQCREGVDKTPKPGKCPASASKDLRVLLGYGCMLDGASCDYDSECGQNEEKCCLNKVCGYKECKSAVY